MPAAPTQAALSDELVALHSPDETLRVLPLQCAVCRAEYPSGPAAICERCLGPLEPIYPAGRTLPDRAAIAKRDRSLWRYAEFLPFEGVPTLSLDTGMTPLVEAPAL